MPRTNIKFFLLATRWMVFVHSQKSTMINAPSNDGLYMVITMKKALAVLFVLMSLGATTQAYAGNCQHDSDTASDGSRCGGRSADSRPGGGGSR